MWFNWRRILTEWNLIVFIIFFTMIGFHILAFPSFSELEDIVRIFIFIIFIAYLSNKISFNIIDYTLLTLLLLNVIAVQYFESGDSYGLSKIIHTRDLKTSYGRHSGLFTNVATLGLFSMSVIVYNIASISYTGTKKYLRIMMVLFSSYLLFESGSKTSMLVVIICTTSIIFSRLRYKKGLKTVTIFITISSLLVYLFSNTIINDYRELNTLLVILKGNIQTEIGRASCRERV